jgi:hypothetical protein
LIELLAGSRPLGFQVFHSEPLGHFPGLLPTLPTAGLEQDIFK